MEAKTSNVLLSIIQGKNQTGLQSKNIENNIMTVMGVDNSITSERLLNARNRKKGCRDRNKTLFFFLRTAKSFKISWKTTH